MANVPTAGRGRRAVITTAMMTTLFLLAVPDGSAASGCTANSSPLSCPTLAGVGSSGGSNGIEVEAEQPPPAPLAAPPPANPDVPSASRMDEAPVVTIGRSTVASSRPDVVATTDEAPVLGLTAEPEHLTARDASTRRSPLAPTSPPPESERSTFAESIPRPSEVSWSVGHVAGNASLALLLVLLLGLPAELLNSSIKARMERRPARAPWRPLVGLEERVNQLPDPLLLVGFGVVSAVVYSQLDPDIGFDRTSMLFVGSLALALITVTGVLEAVRIPYLRRRHEVGSHLRMFPKALLAAVILVVLSRVTGFHPGFIFGVTCGLAVSGRLADEDEGRSIALACTGLLVVAAIAWLFWIPASDAASADHPGTWAIIFDTFLATLWVTGLQVVLFGLLPVRFLYGEKVRQWSRTGWLTLYGVATFLFVQTLFHPSAGQWGGFSAGTMWLLAGSGVVLLTASVAFWLWVRLRTPDQEPALA